MWRMRESPLPPKEPTLPESGYSQTSAGIIVDTEM